MELYIRERFYQRIILEGILYQNLLDAGCSKQLVERCMGYAESGIWKNMLPLLTGHKTELLNIVHTGQKQIDCLDYLIYKIKKEAMVVSNDL